MINKIKKKFQDQFLIYLVIINSIILFFCSSLRHYLFKSNALDLGWFDQAIYLISQGQEPIVSFSDFHILGDHAAFIFYPIALLYKIYPDVHWLFALQAVALSMGIFPLWYLAKKENLQEQQAKIIVFVYLLYPLIFNVNLFDFHAEVIALPLFLSAVLFSKINNIIYFIIAIMTILSCKAILSLTVISMGLWLLFFEKKRPYGLIAIILGVAWFLISTQIIIPHFTGKDVAIEMADGRYSYLGDSLGEIIKNLIFKPYLLLNHLFSLSNLEYIILLIIPVIWGLHFKYLTPLIPAIPALSLNLMTDYLSQKNLTNQYALPILPFLLIAVITTIAHQKNLIKLEKHIIIWSLICFLALAKYGYFFSIYLEQNSNSFASREAIAKIEPEKSVLTVSQFSTHLTHRSLIKVAYQGTENINLNQFVYILLNQRDPGDGSSQETIKTIINRLNNLENFNLIYQTDDIFLFKQK